MNDPFERLAETVMAIKSDEELRKCFVEILKFGPSTQQVRVSTLKLDDKLASAVLKAIESPSEQF